MTKSKEIEKISKNQSINRQNVAVALLNDKGELLYCQRALTKKFLPGIWHLPGGKIEEGETAEDALVREIKEELSLTISNIVLTEISHTYHVGEDLHRTIFYIAIATGNITLDFENSDYKFLSLGQLADYLEEHVLEINKEVFKIALLNSLVSEIK